MSNGKALRIDYGIVFLKFASTLSSLIYIIDSLLHLSSAISIIFYRMFFSLVYLCLCLLFAVIKSNVTYIVVRIL